MSILKPPDLPRIHLVDVPEAKDCMVVHGTVVPPLEAADRAALAVLNQVLGGTTNSRLFLNLRESKAYAYRAFSQVDSYRAGGIFSARALVRPDVASESVLEIEKEIAALAKTPVSSAEIELAKSYLIGHFPLSLASFDAFAETASEVLAYDRGEEAWSRYYDEVMAVTPERVFSVAQALLVRPFVTVIAGDKNVLQSRLTGLEAFDVYDNQGRFQYHVAREKKGAEHETRGVRPEFQRRPGQR